LLTRTLSQVQSLQTLLSEQGYQPVLFPTLEIKSLNNKPLKANYDALIFISANAVEYGLETLKMLDYQSTKVFAVGAATAWTISRRSPLTTSQTSLFTASDSLKDGLPSRSSSAKLSLPSANPLCHLNINERLTLLCFSDRFKNLCVSVGVFPMSTQNFITARCSTFSANVPFFSNADPVSI
jgi:hypothetical protein